jgi:hypothetical protein
LRWRKVAALAVGVALAASACSGGDDGVKRGKDGRVTSGGDVSVFDVLVGDCIVPPTDVKAELERVRVVPCTENHTQEAYAVETYTNGDAYPGDSALSAFADGACLEKYQGYVGVAYQDSKLFYTYLLPSARSWNEGKDRKVVCIITTTGEQLTQSVKDSQR